MRYEVLLICGVLVLGGCATLNESECRSADWSQLGARDGGLGYSRDRLQDHRKACSEFGLAADDAAWSEGYAAGLADYCTADNGYRVGRQGGHYANVCPAQAERRFVPAYELGRETYDLEREMEELDRRIESLQARLIGDKIDDGVRVDVRRQLADLYNRSHWLRRSLDRLDAEWRRRSWIDAP